MGSGNAGGTNALRTQGKAFAFWVMLIDIGKGWVATRVVAPLVVPDVSASADAPRFGVAAMRPHAWHIYAPIHDWLGAAWPHDWLAAACGIAVMLGHIYPLWYGFRGGKGVATLVGAVLGIDVWLLLPMLVTWLLAVIVFGFVGLASMLGAAALAVAAAFGDYEPRAPLLTFGALTAALIAFTHRANIARMLAGTEPRARRLWLLGLRRRSA